MIKAVTGGLLSVKILFYIIGLPGQLGGGGGAVVTNDCMVRKDCSQ